VIAVALMLNYVETMVIPGIIKIQLHFSSSETVTSWITSAFLITGSAVSPLFGKLGDTHGKKKMLLVALAFYSFGVGIAGFSPTIYFLLASRAIQGVGFAILPLSLAIIADTFPKERIAAAQGAISATFAIGAAAGLLIGSYVVEDLGWQYAFHTAFILSIVLGIIVWRVIKPDAPGQARSIDFIGAGMLMTGVTLLLVYATEGPTLGWFALEELAFLLPGAALTVLFFFFERTRRDPLIGLELLRIRNVLVSNLIGIVSGTLMFLLFFALVYYAEYVPYGPQLSIVQTGLTMAPATVAMLLVGPLAGRAVARIGPRPVLFLSSLVMLSGLFLFIFNRATAEDLTFDMTFALIGVVCMIIPIVNMVTIALPRETVAVGLGINTMLRNLGGAIGPVVATSIMTSYMGLYNVFGQERPAPTPTAFNIIFEVGMVLAVCVAVLAYASQNYTFKPKRNSDAQPPSQ